MIVNLNNIFARRPGRTATDRARALLERMLAGESTVAEERELYAFFSTYRRLPSDLEANRDIVAWLGNGLDDKAVTRSRRVGRSEWRSLAAAAGVTGIIIAVAASLKPGQTNPEYSRYEGSYVIVDGKKITDIEEIYPELQQAQDLIAQANADIARANRDCEELRKIIDRDFYADNDN